MCAESFNKKRCDDVISASLNPIKQTAILESKHLEINNESRLVTQLTTVNNTDKTTHTKDVTRQSRTEAVRGAAMLQTAISVPWGTLSNSACGQHVMFCFVHVKMLM